MNETLRINGTARITDDARLLAPGAMQNHAPKVGLIVTVEEAFLHCAKALVRSDLWNAQKHIDRAILPNYPAMLLNHVRGWAVPNARDFPLAGVSVVRTSNTIMCGESAPSVPPDMMIAGLCPGARPASRLSRQRTANARVKSLTQPLPSVLPRIATMPRGSMMPSLIA